MMRIAVFRLCGQVSGAPSGRARPVVRADQRAHFAAAGKKGRGGQAGGRCIRHEAVRLFQRDLLDAAGHIRADRYCKSGA